MFHQTDPLGYLLPEQQRHTNVIQQKDEGFRLAITKLSFPVFILQKVSLKYYTAHFPKILSLHQT